MTKDEFLVLFIHLIIQRSSNWLPEESTEEFMFDTMRQRIDEHGDEIKLTLKKEN